MGLAVGIKGPLLNAAAAAAAAAAPPVTPARPRVVQSTLNFAAANDASANDSGIGLSVQLRTSLEELCSAKARTAGRAGGTAKASHSRERASLPSVKAFYAASSAASPAAAAAAAAS
eukprot:6868371-Prymnesium_polylepis.1